MNGYELHYQARAALADIYVHTAEKWGRPQADRYLDGLIAKLDDIVARRTFWRPIPASFGVSGFYASYQKHIIYWHMLEDGLLGVAAILHSAMVPDERLKQAFRSP